MAVKTQDDPNTIYSWLPSPKQKQQTMAVFGLRRLGEGLFKNTSIVPLQPGKLAPVSHDTKVAVPDPNKSLSAQNNDNLGAKMVAQSAGLFKLGRDGQGRKDASLHLYKQTAEKRQKTEAERAQKAAEEQKRAAEIKRRADDKERARVDKINAATFKQMKKKAREKDRALEREVSRQVAGYKKEQREKARAASRAKFSSAFAPVVSFFENVKHNSGRIAVAEKTNPKAFNAVGKPVFNLTKEINKFGSNVEHWFKNRSCKKVEDPLASTSLKRPVIDNAFAISAQSTANQQSVAQMQNALIAGMNEAMQQNAEYYAQIKAEIQKTLEATKKQMEAIMLDYMNAVKALQQMPVPNMALLQMPQPMPQPLPQRMPQPLPQPTPQPLPAPALQAQAAAMYRAQLNMLGFRDLSPRPRRSNKDTHQSASDLYEHSKLSARKDEYWRNLSKLYNVEEFYQKFDQVFYENIDIFEADYKVEVPVENTLGEIYRVNESVLNAPDATPEQKLKAQTTMQNIRDIQNDMFKIAQNYSGLNATEQYELGDLLHTYHNYINFGLDLDAIAINFPQLTNPETNQDIPVSAEQAKELIDVGVVPAPKKSDISSGLIVNIYNSKIDTLFNLASKEEQQQGLSEYMCGEAKEA